MTSNRRADVTFLWVCLALGLIVRIAVWWAKGGMHYPDEVFQYLEPANLRLTGLAWLPWEFDRGVRSWILPTFYGGLSWWGRELGMDGWTLQRALGLHNALWSLLLIPAAYRLADAFGGRAAARISAALAAFYLPIVFFMPHTLSEVPGLLLTTWGLAWFAESRTSGKGNSWPFKSGLALGMASIVRPTLVLWTLVPAFYWLFRGRIHRLLLYAAGGVLVVVVSGAVDWITWGSLFHSTIEYVEYNLIEKGASHHGTSPWAFYLDVWFWQRMGIGGLLVVITALCRPRKTVLLLLAAAVPVVALSLIEHKEERFLLSSYPLLLAAGAVAWAWLWERFEARRAWAIATILTLVVLTTGAIGTLALDWRWRAGVYAGQQFVGHQEDATGVLLDDRIHLNGGYFVLDRHIPQLQFSIRLARHELFNYAVVKTGSEDADVALRLRFEPVAQFDDATVYKR